MEVIMKKEKHNIPILIGENLKNIRISLGLTQEEVAESLGLAPRYLSDIERNKTKGSITTLVKLCNLYKVTPTVVLKDYLSTSDSNLDDSISGFNNLEENEKNIIRKLIQYMNSDKKQHKKTKKSNKRQLKNNPKKS